MATLGENEGLQVDIILSPKDLFIPQILEVSRLVIRHLLKKKLLDRYTCVGFLFCNSEIQDMYDRRVMRLNVLASAANLFSQEGTLDLKLSDPMSGVSAYWYR